MTRSIWLLFVSISGIAAADNSIPSANRALLARCHQQFERARDEFAKHVALRPLPEIEVKHQLSDETPFDDALLFEPWSNLAAGFMMAPAPPPNGWRSHNKPVPVGWFKE